MVRKNENVLLTTKPTRPRRATGLHFAADYQAIGRILTHVQEAGGTIPAGLLDTNGPERATVREQRQTLATAISYAFIRANVYPDLTDDERSKNRYERLGQASKLADRLLRIIDLPSNPLTPRLAAHFPACGDAVTLARLLDGLRHLSAVAQEERLQLEASGLHVRAPFGDEPGEISAGDERIMKLGQVFERTFDDTIRFPQKDDDGDFGPFVAFVMAIYKHVGADMTPESVRAIWRRAQNKVRKMPIPCSCDGDA